MSVTGFWVVGIVPDSDVVRMRREFPGADSFGRHDPEPSGDLEWWSGEGPWIRSSIPDRTDLCPRSRRCDSRTPWPPWGSADERHEAVKEELLQLVPQCEGVDLFCVSTRKGDPLAALHYGLGPEAAFQLPGRDGDFLLDAAGVRAALPGVEVTLDLAPVPEAASRSASGTGSAEWPTEPSMTLTIWSTAPCAYCVTLPRTVSVPPE